MKITTSSVINWLREPTTAGGLIGIAGAVPALFSHTIPHAITYPVLSGCIMALLLPGNSRARSDAARLATDGIAAVATRSPAAIAAVVTDVDAVASDLMPSVTTTTTTTVLTPTAVAAVAPAEVASEVAAAVIETHPAEMSAAVEGVVAAAEAEVSVAVKAA
jgi:hypothetical protein